MFVGATPLRQQPHFTLPQHPVLLLLLLFLFLFFMTLCSLASSSVSPLIVHSLSLSSSASLSEYGPHRLPISLVCRRLQRLLRLADPPEQGQRVAPSSSSEAPERQTRRAATSTAAPAAETQPCTGYPPLCAPHPCSTPPPYNLAPVCRGSQAPELMTNPTGVLFPFPNNAPCTY